MPEEFSYRSFLLSEKRKFVVPIPQDEQKESVDEIVERYHHTVLPSKNPHYGILITENDQKLSLLNENLPQKPHELRRGTFQIIGHPYNTLAEKIYRTITHRRKQTADSIIHQSSGLLQDAYNQYHDFSTGSSHPESVRIGIERFFRTRNLELVGLGLTENNPTKELQGEYTLQLLGGSFMNQRVILEKSTNPRYHIE